jgi:hypothetical protein
MDAGNEDNVEVMACVPPAMVAALDATLPRVQEAVDARDPAAIEQALHLWAKCAHRIQKRVLARFEFMHEPGDQLWESLEKVWRMLVELGDDTEGESEQAAVATRCVKVACNVLLRHYYAKLSVDLWGDNDELDPDTYLGLARLPENGAPVPVLRLLFTEWTLTPVLPFRTGEMFQMLADRQTPRRSMQCCHLLFGALYGQDSVPKDLRELAKHVGDMFLISYKSMKDGLCAILGKPKEHDDDDVYSRLLCGGEHGQHVLQMFARMQDVRDKAERSNPELTSQELDCVAWDAGGPLPSLYALGLARVFMLRLHKRVEARRLVERTEDWRAACQSDPVLGANPGAFHAAFDLAWEAGRTRGLKCLKRARASE